MHLDMSLLILDNLRAEEWPFVFWCLLNKCRTTKVNTSWWYKWFFNGFDTRVAFHLTIFDIQPSVFTKPAFAKTTGSTNFSHFWRTWTGQGLIFRLSWWLTLFCLKKRRQLGLRHFDRMVYISRIVYGLLLDFCCKKKENQSKLRYSYSYWFNLHVFRT